MLKNDKMNILVVDDSAVVRQTMTDILSRDGNHVKTATDPYVAMDKMRHWHPDVILLDLEMPRMNGLTFLKILQRDSIPVVICSSLSGKVSDVAIRALMDEGAIEVVAKPQFGIRGFLEESAIILIDTLRGAAKARMKHRVPFVSTEKVKAGPGAPDKITHGSRHQIIAMGASTGGTEALSFLLQCLPADSPGVVVVQHMPEGFTAAFAKRLNTVCSIQVKEAENSDQVFPGRALIAPGNRHLILHRNTSGYFVETTNGPLVSRHRPSVDVLFQSVAKTAGSKAIGIILTGMGDDGAQGMLEMKQAGADTIAQDESSCVVFGMPKEAIARNAVDEIHSLQRIPQAILKRIQAGRS